MRKKPTKKRATSKKVKRLGKSSAHTTTKMRAKPQTTLQKIRAAQKMLKAKLAALKIEFKDKLRLATEMAYEKAHTEATRNYEKKAQAKQKALAATETKFEKKHAKKILKTTKPKRRAKRKAAIKHPAIKSTNMKSATRSKTKRRRTNKAKR